MNHGLIKPVQGTSVGELEDMLNLTGMGMITLHNVSNKDNLG